MAAAAMTKFDKPVIEVYYTNGKQIQKANYDYGKCVPLQPQPGVWIDHKHLTVKSQCNYYYDPQCLVPARPFIVHQPGNYNVDKVKQYGKCTLATS
ncbi:hypothetical protein [Absidia glauca]|uniref:Uncharacterized protein n=1 Tax=Absidia glauca TaxID=4829 RepID=A0A163KQ65_ABSGL|nr:hypothetical protein [Absidia glauca]